jgi:hypothetical protein
LYRRSVRRRSLPKDQPIAIRIVEPGILSPRIAFDWEDVHSSHPQFLRRLSDIVRIEHQALKTAWGHLWEPGHQRDRSRFPIGSELDPSLRAFDDVANDREAQRLRIKGLRDLLIDTGTETIERCVMFITNAFLSSGLDRIQSCPEYIWEGGLLSCKNSTRSQRNDSSLPVGASLKM